MLQQSITVGAGNPWDSFEAHGAWPNRVGGHVVGLVRVKLDNPTITELSINMSPNVPASEVQGMAEALRRHYQSEETADTLEERDRSLPMPPRTVSDANPQLTGWLAQVAQSHGKLTLDPPPLPANVPPPTAAPDTPSPGTTTNAANVDPTQLRRADSGKFDHGGAEQTKALTNAYKNDPLPEAVNSAQADGQGAAAAFEAGRKELDEHPFEPVSVNSDAELPPQSLELSAKDLKIAREEMERKVLSEYYKALSKVTAAERADRAGPTWWEWANQMSTARRRELRRELKEAYADFNGAKLALSAVTGRTDYNPRFFAGDEAATWSYTRKFAETLNYAIQNNYFAADLRQRASDFLNAVTDPVGGAQMLGTFAVGYAVKKGVCRVARERTGIPVAKIVSVVFGAAEGMVLAAKVEALRQELDGITFKSEVANAAPHLVSLIVEMLQDHFFMNWVRKFSCFVAGTQVVTAVVRDAEAPGGVRYVSKNIEDLRIGDVVYARDEFGAAVGVQRVTETFRRSVEQLRVLTFSDAAGVTQTLRATTEHPFWLVNRNEFVPARMLEPGAVFVGPHGERQTLVSNAEEFHPNGVLVYNITVSDWHTYFVSESADATPIWVHNKCGITTTRDAVNRITKVDADVKTTDLYSGTSTNQKVRDLARSQGDALDDAGHLIAKRLGGEADVDNIVGMNRKLNRGDYAQFEKRIAEKLEDLGNKGSAKIEIELKYDGASMRPKAIIYKVSFSDGTSFEPEKFKNLAN